MSFGLSVCDRCVSPPCRKDSLLAIPFYDTSLIYFSQGNMRKLHDEGMAMDLLDIRLFREVIRLGSLTDAAVSLSLSQPTASRRIQRLERELNTRLIHRNPSPAQPTIEGLLFLEFADKVTREFSELVSRIDPGRHLLGILSVATSTTPAVRLVTEWIADFVAGHPRIQVKLGQMASSAVEQALLSGKASIGFTGIAAKASSITSLSIATDEIVLLLPNKVEFSHIGEQITADDLFSLPFVEREQGSGTWDTVRDTLRQAGHDRPFQTIIEVNSTQAVVTAVEAGLGAGFVSRQILSARPLRGARPVSVENLSFIRHLYLLFREEDFEANPVARAFVRFAHLRLDRRY